MNSTALDQEHGKLVEDVAALVGRLRQVGYGPAFDLAAADVAGELDRVRAHLIEHMKFEETVLLPALEQAATEVGHDTVHLRREHRDLRMALAELADETARRSPRARSVAARLLGMLLSHMEREEEVINHVARRIPAERLAALSPRLTFWHVERWLERAAPWLALAGIEVHVRDIHNGVALLAVKTPVTDPKARHDLEVQLTRRLRNAEPSLSGVEVVFGE